LNLGVVVRSIGQFSVDDEHAPEEHPCTALEGGDGTRRISALGFIGEVIGTGIERPAGAIFARVPW
jgi:hypothetical protein